MESTQPPSEAASLPGSGAAPEAVIAPELEESFERLTATVRSLRPAEDLAPLRRAFVFAYERHGSQKRSSGDPYITHPMAVAQILAEMQMDKLADQRIGYGHGGEKNLRQERMR